MNVIKTFMCEKNGFRIHKLSVNGSVYYVAEKQIANEVKRYIRKSYNLLERIISV